MLKITLYKNCILNDSYKEVFSLGKETGQDLNVLERYLNTLTSNILPNLDNVYYENSGDLVFDANILATPYSIYDFNYMKIEEYNENVLTLTRYCFVQSIELKNELCYISYKEDIWHSYADKIAGTTKAFLSNSRVLNYENLDINLKTLPTSYEGNNELEITTLIHESESLPYPAYFYLIAEVQFYQLDQYDKITKRFSRYVRVQETDTPTDSQMHKSLYGCEEWITKLEKIMTNGIFLENGDNSSDGYKYHIELGKFYILPYQLFPELSVITTYYILENDNLVLKLLNYTQGTPKLQYQNTIVNNYKNLYFGFLAHLFELKNNGTDIDYSIYTKVAEFGINIYMSINNNFEDITDAFEYNVPIEGLTSDTYMQRNIGLNIQHLSYKNIVDKSDVGMIASFMKGVVTNFGILANGALGNNFALGSEDAGLSTAGTFSKFAANTIDTAKVFADNYSNRITAQHMDENIMSKAYVSNKKVTVSRNKVMSLIYGLVLISINSDNDNYVKETINMFGYDTFEYIKDFNKIQLSDIDYFKSINCNYNILSFSIINLYGSFTREISLILNTIFKNGVKIWYDYQMNEDNYVV